jgi:hypothetical protein
LTSNEINKTNRRDDRFLCQMPVTSHILNQSPRFLLRSYSLLRLSIRQRGNTAQLIFHYAANNPISPRGDPRPPSSDWLKESQLPETWRHNQRPIGCPRHSNRWAYLVTKPVRPCKSSTLGRNLEQSSTEELGIRGIREDPCFF